MSTGTIVLIVTLLIMVAAIVALYFMGKKAQARKEVLMPLAPFLN